MKKFFFPPHELSRSSILPFLIWNPTFVSIVFLYETYRALRF